MDKKSKYKVDKKSMMKSMEKLELFAKRKSEPRILPSYEELLAQWKELIKHRAEENVDPTKHLFYPPPPRTVKKKARSRERKYELQDQSEEIARDLLARCRNQSGDRASVISEIGVVVGPDGDFLVDDDVLGVVPAEEGNADNEEDVFAITA